MIVNLSVLDNLWSSERSSETESKEDVKKKFGEKTEIIKINNGSIFCFDSGIFQKNVWKYFFSSQILVQKIFCEFFSRKRFSLFRSKKNIKFIFILILRTMSQYNSTNSQKYKSYTNYKNPSASQPFQRSSNSSYKDVTSLPKLSWKNNRRKNLLQMKNTNNDNAKKDLTKTYQTKIKPMSPQVKIAHFLSKLNFNGRFKWRKWMEFGIKS